MLPSTKQLQHIAIGLAIIANMLVIACNEPIVGLWGFVMQFVYLLMMERLPIIKIRSLPFLGLCCGLYVHNCLWFYFIPYPTAVELAFLLISVWISPSFFILNGSPSNEEIVADDLEC